MTAPDATGPAPILRPGWSCAAAAEATASGLLIDARNYYRAFYRAARQARRYVLIAGWRFNSDLRLLRGDDARREAGAEKVEFLPFLQSLCDANPDLHVHVLAWDFSINYGLEWEWFQRWKFETGADDRIHFRFDDNHSVGGSHHQKFVVIDGRLAFVGGLDFCAGDWDGRRHRAHDPDRIDCGQDQPHCPYHDLQAFVTGPAALLVRDYFRERWRRATGKELALPDPPPGEPPAVQATVPLGRATVALSRNQPATLSDPEPVLEIRRLYPDAIASAERLIYMENQYFSSQVVYDALVRRLTAADRPKLDLVLVLPKQVASWVEAIALEGARLPMLDGLRQTAHEHGHRLGLYYPVSGADDGTEEAVLVHSKLLIVDDRFLTVGSCNASNRSMGLDTELNLSWEAKTPADRDLVRAIRRVRASLLTENCGLWRLPELRRRVRRRRGLVRVLNELSGDRAQCLRPLTNEAVLEDREWVRTLSEWNVQMDPDHPVVEDGLKEVAEKLPALAVVAGVVSFREWLSGGT
jgi:phosphatidylserine/phosphatidylglycerophosphate/cardiolipin synthase-like enzyme